MQAEKWHPRLIDSDPLSLLSLPISLLLAAGLAFLLSVWCGSVSLAQNANALDREQYASRAKAHLIELLQGRRIRPVQPPREAGNHFNCSGINEAPCQRTMLALANQYFTILPPLEFSQTSAQLNEYESVVASCQNLDFYLRRPADSWEIRSVGRVSFYTLEVPVADYPTWAGNRRLQGLLIDRYEVRNLGRVTMYRRGELHVFDRQTCEILPGVGLLDANENDLRDQALQRLYFAELARLNGELHLVDVGVAPFRDRGGERVMLLTVTSLWRRQLYQFHLEKR